MSWTSGAAALSDTELLALLLRTGLAGKGVMTLAQELVDTFGGLAGLLHTDARALGRIKGLGGPAKRSQLVAVLELARRAMAEQLRARQVLDTPEALAHYLQLHLAHRGHEVFAVLFLDAQHRLIALEEMFRGTLAETSVYPREVVVRALDLQAAAVVLAHNHPTGDPTPSRDDIEMTRAVKLAMEQVGVSVHDHIIIGRKGHASLRSMGYLDAPKKR